MPDFSLQDRAADWAAAAPVVITRQFSVPAPPDQVFGLMADIGGWSKWCGGMRKVRLDLDQGPASGVGAVRTVWVGTTRVQERFIVWEPGQRMTFVMTSMNVPGLVAMVEDYALAPEGTGTSVTVTIGVQGGAILGRLPGLVRAIIGSSTKGITGLASQFG
ncbi:MAG TPA: SRPBCC family protein [Acidimicrobiales bacterium]|jgi:carbon monoxide dehydrogenase subunit G|nr:SRPBCC family protein [Acidimicrobiales bacterium]